ncbi:MAG: phosphoribosylformylglycinamidine synthase subunit PurS [Thermoplasmata archaeon]
MLFRIEISYKKGVEDPEALAIQRNIKILGYETIRDVRISKVYYFDAENEDEIEEITKKILANPVINDYTIEMADKTI